MNRASPSPRPTLLPRLPSAPALAHSPAPAPYGLGTHKDCASSHLGSVQARAGMARVSVPLGPLPQQGQSSLDCVNLTQFCGTAGLRYFLAGQGSPGRYRHWSGVLRAITVGAASSPVRSSISAPGVPSDSAKIPHLLLLHFGLCRACLARPSLPHEPCWWLLGWVPGLQLSRAHPPGHSRPICSGVSQPHSEPGDDRKRAKNHVIRFLSGQASLSLPHQLRPTSTFHAALP
ncbi:hypothetical protein NDU88_006891 [Pleurodeles waltl]|uniref:Uncharacterized protein n=1 Tax=Pleurodeles waltl TaxID=8319 RepID=A0AAV7RNJ0_PLEWA|nr:hypothetical protein NDU88_006891 [Pleurodeles waltl]